MLNIKRVGVDLAKNVFQVHAVDANGQAVWRRQLKRTNFLSALEAHVPPGCEIGMEACAGAHHWARECEARSYRAKMMAAQFVTPYVKSNKNDRNDAEGVTEAMSRPGMRFVPVKSVEQQDLQAVHRARSLLISQRTAKANQIRGLVGEYGIVAAKEIGKLRAAIPRWLEDADNGLSDAFRRLLHGLWQDVQRLDQRVEELDVELKALAKSDERARRLMTIHGVGPITATALVVALGDGRAFRRGRDFAVSLGLTPRHCGTGGKARIYGISKRGDSYLRTLLVHCARAVARHAHHRDDPMSRWFNQLRERKLANVAIVALANKIARIAWAVGRHDTTYCPELSAT